MAVNKYNILILDDHPLFRKGLITIIESANFIDRIFEAGSAEEALETVKNNHIDLITVDINLPGIDGMQFIDNVCDNKKAKCLIITTYKADLLLNEAKRRGASGFISKDNVFDNLVDAINICLKGGFYADKSQIAELERFSLEEKTKLYFLLSNTEKEVFKMLSKGNNSKEIAFALKKSIKTVENQRLSVMKKMEINSSIELVKIAMRLNLIDII